MINPNTCFKLFVMLSQLTITIYMINIEHDISIIANDHYFNNDDENR